MPSDEDYAAMAAGTSKIIGRCNVCNEDFYSRESLNRHIDSREHMDKIKRSGTVVYYDGD